MFNQGDIVVNKHTGQLAKVSHIGTDELMTVYFRAYFAKGGFEFYGTQVLMKNFEIVTPAK